MDTTNLIAWLPFDESTTQDFFGNTWTASGNPAIGSDNAPHGKALQLDGSSYLKMTEPFVFNGQPFTISCYFSAASNTTGGSFCIWQLCYDSTYRAHLSISANGILHLWKDSDSIMHIPTSASVLDGQIHHAECDFDGSTWYLFLDGNLIGSKAHTGVARNYTIYIGIHYYTGRKMTGTIDEFQIYDGVALHTGDFTPPSAKDYFQTKLTLGGAYYELSADVERKVKNISEVIADVSREVSNSNFKEISFDLERRLTKSITFAVDVHRIVQNISLLKVYLPFDESTTLDLCGNTWTATGSPTIEEGALKLNGTNCLKLNGGITLGGQDFTICGLAQMNSSAQNWAGIFAFDFTKIHIQKNNKSSTSIYLSCNNTTFSNVTVPAMTQRFHFEIDYEHSSGTWRVFFNGSLIKSYTSQMAQTVFTNVYLGGNGESSTGGYKWGGIIDEFQIYDGVALHTEDFTPPTAEDYFQAKLALGAAYYELSADVERKISNQIEVTFDVERKFKWRYVNPGNADDLIIASTILTDLPADKSSTGTAFYQTTRAKCFDLPATDEVWMKFDVFFDGSNRWRAYNGRSNGTTGATAQTNGDFNVWVNNTDNGATSNVCIANTLRTVLLHMISGSSNGIIEAWVDGEKIYTYTGDVNHGEDFADIYLQSDGAGTFFSNVIISNYEIGLNETLDGRSVVVSFDVEISISRLISLYLDVKRIVITQKVIEQLAEFSSALKVWLPFDTSPVADVCSNAWLDYGNPTIQNKELVLDGSSYLKMYLPFTITRRQSFTVGCWFSATSNTAGEALYLWCLRRYDNSYVFFIDSDNTLKWYANQGYTTDVPIAFSTDVTDGKKHYLEAVFDSGTALIVFLDGVQAGRITTARTKLPNNWNNTSITTLDYEVGVGCDLSRSDPTSGAFIGMIDEFQIYYRAALHYGSFVPPVEASYTALHYKIIENSINVTVDVMRLVKDDTCLKVHLTFDEDVTTDECGNEWTVVGNPTISEEHAIKGKALQLDGESYLKCNSTFTIEKGQPFTIDGWVHVVESVRSYIALCSLSLSLGINDKRTAFLIEKASFADSDKQVHHCAFVSDGLNLYQFVDGTIVSRVSFVKDATANSKYIFQNAELCVGWHYPNYHDGTFTGTIDEFRLIIGDALWTEPFTPSITGEVLDWTKEVVLNCDVMCIVNNVEEPWIYYNIGVANDLNAHTYNNLPANYSRTGCAIRSSSMEFGFPVPATYNFWIRFDFTPQGTSFFWSEHKSKYYGVGLDFNINDRTTAFLAIICASLQGFSTSTSYQGPSTSISGNATIDESANVLHTVLLHIKSGLTDGIVEAWVDKTKSGSVNYLIDRYVGNVNDGVPVYNFVIRSSGYFSNIIISNEPITFDSEIPETHLIELVLDVERQVISNFITYNLDIIRNVIAPIIIPLSGENIEYTLNRIRICSIPQKFILPKISKFYIYGDLVGKVHIYSDTNVEGIINGSYYFIKNSIQSEFIESNEFYIVLDKSIISAQDVIKSFIHKLVTNRLSGTSALNRAVIYATDGRYVSWNDFINQFLNCLNSIDYKRFLDFYCDIILDNDDTGAILGWDAGGVAVRTAISVVTESFSTDAWKIPNLGSSIMISNLLVHFPRYGVDFNLTNLEKYILSGLNSEWIYRSLELIKYSLGISFEDSDITYEMYIRFSHDSSSDTLAYTSLSVNNSCIVTINMYYYSSMVITDVNGLSEYTNMYLDRTIVHELVHAVMALRSYAYDTLPIYIAEGLAELVHGIDDSRKNNIVDLLTTRKNDLISALTSEQYVYPEDAYSVGYILLRFLAKQGQHINNTSSNKLIINNLLVVNDVSLVIKTVQCDVTTSINNYVITQCDVTTSINNYVITQCDVTTSINNYVITQCDVTINHYMIIEYVLDVYCECVVSIIEFISVQINVMCLYTISADVFRRIIGLNIIKFNIMMYGVRNMHINSVAFNIVMYGVSSSISSSIKFVIVDPSKTRTKLHQCIKPVVMLMINPINNIMISDQVSDLALRSTPLYPDRSNKGYNTRG